MEPPTGNYRIIRSVLLSEDFGYHFLRSFSADMFGAATRLLQGRSCYEMIVIVSHSVPTRSAAASLCFRWLNG